MMYNIKIHMKGLIMNGKVSIFEQMPHDENLEIGNEGYIIDEPETLNDLGFPNAYMIDVSVDNGMIVVTVHENGESETIYTHLTAETVNHYLSLKDLYFILNADNS